MIITPLKAAGEWEYHIEHDDGTIEEHAREIPERFRERTTGTVFDKRIQPSEYVLLLENQLRIQPNDPAEFMRMVQNSEFEFRLAALFGEKRQTFLLTLLQRAEDVFDLRDAVDISHPIACFINEKCRGWLFDYWLSDISPDGKMYDFAGVIAVLEMLGQGPSEARYRFLERIVEEHKEPISCKFRDHLGGDNDRNPFILISHPHSFTNSELEFLHSTLATLQLESSSPAGSTPVPAWHGTLTDLVFIFDALEDEGYLTATDAAIVTHIGINSTSKDRAKVYRDTRKKLREGMAYPDKARLERLIARLQQGLG